jgi:hypothetical protein
LQLAAANTLNAVMTAQGAIYYAVAADTSQPALQPGLYKIGPDGTAKQHVFKQEVETVLRSTYKTFNLQTAEGTWYTYNLSDGSNTALSTPGSLVNRLYVDNTDRSKSLWTAQGTLTSYETATGKETVVKSQSGLAYPVQWLGPDAALYRLSIGSETADYAISVQGGIAHKVSDVAATTGFAQ